MKRPYQITAVVLLLFSASFGVESVSLKFESSVGPGPGLFPFWTSVILGMLSILLLYQATFKPQDPMPEDFIPPRRLALRPLAILLALVATTLLMPVAGFRLTMLVFYIFLLAILGRQRLLVTIPIALFGSWGVFHFFNYVLMVPLPIGVLDF